MAGKSFTAQINEEFKEFGAKASAVVTRAAKVAWKAGVNITPVRTGTLRAGWKISNVRRSSYEPTVGIKGYPQTPNFTFRITKDKRVYFFNNVFYCSFVNDGEGRGQRSPVPMIQTIQDVFSNQLEAGFRGIK